MSKLSKFLRTKTGDAVKDLLVDAVIAKAKKQSADVRRVAGYVEPVLETYQAVKASGSDNPLRDTICARAKTEISERVDAVDAIKEVTGDNVKELIGQAIPKPYLQTSYFILLVLVIIGGGALTVATSILLPGVDFLTNEQRAEILQTMFQGWAGSSSVVVGGNVLARGGLTLLKQWLQNQIIKSTVEGPTEMPPSQHQPQPVTTVQQPVVLPLPDEAPPTTGNAVDTSKAVTAMAEAG